MQRFIEGELNSSFRFANPNYNTHLDSLPRIERIGHPGKAEISEENIQGHEKRIRMRTLPTLRRILRAANGANSKSAVVFRSVFDIAKSA
jgi:hypothetical protein